ncbi:MAG TPA: MlaE family lipid ABC transporter permease subunit [Desulfobacteria bacterium]|nr:MlaE family lipid ABC transporter permease subunit [Desulfobacteria bacterium]
MNTTNPSLSYDISKNPQGGTTIGFHGRMDSSSAGALIEELSHYFTENPPGDLSVDLENVIYLDDFGTLVLVELRKITVKEHGEFQLLNAGEKIREMLMFLRFDSLFKKVSFEKKRRQGIFVRLGEKTFDIILDLEYAVSFIGAITLSLGYHLAHPKALRKEDTLDYMQKTGVDGLPIVALISFLMGLIMAFMSSVQLEQFGANIYVASLVSLSMTRELGPIMTAIIVAGRSGSAFAAEIGTMKISEEVDALFTMGFDPVGFLVIPKLIAALVMVPILTLFSDIFAIAGGLLVGVFMLDLTAGSYVSQTIATLTIFDVFWGVMKSAVFALLITWVGCLRGFQVSGGASSVGQATTSAVVSSIFLIILFDSVFSVVLRYTG